MIGSGSPILFGLLPRETFEAIYADGPDVIGGGSLAPRGRATPVADGYCVSGQWSFASGCQHASWLLAQSVVTVDGQVQMMENGVPAMKVAVFPAHQVEIVDTWRVAGLRGTGSHDIRVNEAFCPDERTFVLFGAAPTVEGPIFAIPPMAQLPLLLSSVALGIGRAAIDDVAALAGGGKKRVFATKRLAESPVFQDRLGEADAMLRAARALLHTEVEHAWAKAVAGGGCLFSPLDRARLRATATQVVSMATQVVDAAYLAGGGTALYEVSPLQRRLRDVHALTQHIGVGREAFAFVGALLSGEELDPLRPI
jgi:alkylation response protein AidB-like acyl-CoA dehydrogenase